METKSYSDEEVRRKRTRKLNKGFEEEEEASQDDGKLTVMLKYYFMILFGFLPK